MFARDTYRPTFTGPIRGSAETLSQNKSQAGATRSFVGNARAFAPQAQMQGVRAGGAGTNYRAGMAGNAAAAQAGDHHQAQIARIAEDGQARDAYAGNRAEEQDGLRRLLFDRDQTERTSANALRKDNAFARTSDRQRMGERTMGQRARGNDFFGFLGGLLS